MILYFFKIQLQVAKLLMTFQKKKNLFTKPQWHDHNITNSTTPNETF
jgi:hypothetical protein